MTDLAKLSLSPNILDVLLSLKTVILVYLEHIRE